MLKNQDFNSRPPYKRWLVDFDSTLSDTFSTQIEALNQRFGTSYTREDFHSWNTEEIISQEEYDFLWGEECFLSESFQMACPPLPNAIETVKDWVDRYETVMVVSDRPQALMNVTVRWLAEHNLNIPIVFTRSRHSKSDQSTDILTKSQASYLYKLNMVVEDSPHHSLLLANRGYVHTVYLLDTPTNRHVKHDKIIRVNSWKDVHVKDCIDRENVQR